MVSVAIGCKKYTSQKHVNPTYNTTYIYTETHETLLLPKNCSCVYTCSAVHPSLTWQFYIGMDKKEEIFDQYSYVNVPRPSDCYIFELTERIETTGLSYSMTSTLTLNPNCSNDEIINTTVRCLTRDDDVEEISVCLPGRKLYIKP